MEYSTEVAELEQSKRISFIQLKIGHLISRLNQTNRQIQRDLEGVTQELERWKAILEAHAPKK